MGYFDQRLNGFIVKLKEYWPENSKVFHEVFQEEQCNLKNLGFKFEQLVLIAEQLLDGLIEVKNGNKWKCDSVQTISCQSTETQWGENFKDSLRPITSSVNAKISSEPIIAKCLSKVRSKVQLLPQSMFQESLQGFTLNHILDISHLCKFFLKCSDAFIAKDLISQRANIHFGHKICSVDTYTNTFL